MLREGGTNHSIKGVEKMNNICLKISIMLINTV